MIKRDDMGGACSMNGLENCIISVNKPGGKTSLGRARHRWVDNNILDL